MPALELVIALLVAIVLAAVLTWALQRQGPGPWGGLLFFFLILFLAVWAGGLWLTPVGPLTWGVPWAAFLVVGVLVALILAAAVPARRPPGRRAEGEAVAGETAAVALGLFFYLALLAFLVAIGAHYLWRF